MKPAEPDLPRDDVVPTVEEQVRISKAVEETGAVRVRVESEVATAEGALDTAADEVEVQRVPVNAVVDERREPWIDDGAIVVPIYEEVVERRLVLREEVRLVRRRTVTEQRISVPVRRERAVVERRQADGSWRPVDPTELARPSMDSTRRESDGPTFDVPSNQRRD